MQGQLFPEKMAKFPIVLPLTSCVVSRFFPGTQELGELYSLACDTDHFVTGHTLLADGGWAAA